MKKGRHRRYEEARALKRGSDLDIESIFSDLASERGEVFDDDVDEGDEYDEETGEFSEDGAEQH